MLLSRVVLLRVPAVPQLAAEDAEAERKDHGRTEKERRIEPARSAVRVRAVERERERDQENESNGLPSADAKADEDGQKEDRGEDDVVGHRAGYRGRCCRRHRVRC